MAQALWTTLQNMTVSERLFFRRRYGRKNIPLHIQLYDKIVKWSFYNEALLTKNNTHFTNLNYTKHILCKELYKSLAEYATQHNNEMQLLEDIIIIKTLRQKNQIEEALQILKKAIRKINIYEYYTIGKLLIDEYMKLILFNSTNANTNDIHEVIEFSKPLLFKQTDTTQIKTIYISILNLRKQSNLALNQNEFNILSDYEKQISKIPRDDTNKTATNFYNMSLSSLYYMKGDFGKALNMSKKNLLLWQENTTMIDIDPEFYLDALQLFTDISILLKQFSAALDSIHHLCNSHLKGNYASINFDILKFRCLNRIYNKTADYTNVSLLLTTHKNRFNEWLNFSNLETKIVVANSIGISHFILKKHADAYYYIHETIQSITSSTRKEIQSFAHLFIVLICFELNNSNQFESHYRSSYNFFYRHKSHFKFEKEILLTLHAIFKNKKSAIVHEKISALLYNLEKTKDDVSQQFIFNIFNFSLWLRSKLEKKDYRQMVKENI